MSDWVDDAEDWKDDAPAEKAPTLAEKYKPSTVDTVAHGALQGASYGLADEAQGVLGGARELKDQIARAFGGGTPIDPQEDVFAASHPVAGVNGSWDSILKAYRAERDAARKEDRQAQQANPTTGIASSLGGALIAPGPKGAAVEGAVPRALQMAGRGAKQGAVYGAGDSEADLTKGEVGKFATDTLGGGAVGGLVGGALGGLSSKVQGWLGKTADDQALRAAGLRGGISNKLDSMGYHTSEDSQELGHEIRKANLVPLWSKPADVAERAEAYRVGAGNQLRSALGKADASRVEADPRAMADAARQVVNTADPVARAQGGKALSLADLLENGEYRDALGHPKAANYSDLHAGKSSAWGAANFKDDAPVAAKLYRQSTGAAAENLGHQVEDAAGPEVANSYRDASKKYGLAKDVLKLANDTANRTKGHQTFSLAEVLAALGASGAGVQAEGTKGLAAGPAALLLSHLAKTRGPGLATNLAGAAESRVGNAAPAGARSFAEYLELMKDKDNE